HFLEMWDEPALVGGVAGETAAQVIVDSSSSHLVEGVTHDMEGLVILRSQMVAQEYFEVHRVGELGCLAESTVLWVKVSQEGASGAVQQPGIDRSGALRDRADGPQLLGHESGGFGDLIAPLDPGLMDALEHTGKAGHPARIGRRKISSTEE